MTSGLAGHHARPRDLLDSATNGDRVSLARLLSMVERGAPSAREVDRVAFPLAGKAYTVGITGAPGAGKSSLTDRLVSIARANDGADVAVLAVDPSSPLSGGALLGDRLRMQEHALDSGVFIRSMASRGHLGGLSSAVPVAARVLDAVGMATVFVETVGVGQVEVEVAGATDTTIMVVTPGWGDYVQTSKAGLLEVADIFVVNKADRQGAREAVLDLRRMLELSAGQDWEPPIVSTVATAGEGTADLWEQIERHRSYLEDSGNLVRRRSERLEEEMRRILVRELEDKAVGMGESDDWRAARDALLSKRLPPYDAAEQVLEHLGR